MDGNRMDGNRAGCDERGSVLPLMAVAVALTVMLIFGVGALGRRTVARAEAQSAADMAALAGVVEGRAGAEDLAVRNKATLMSFGHHGARVQVVVERDGVRATAAAVLAP